MDSSHFANDGINQVPNGLRSRYVGLDEEVRAAGKPGRRLLSSLAVPMVVDRNCPAQLRKFMRNCTPYSPRGPRYKHVFACKTNIHIILPI